MKTVAVLALSFAVACGGCLYSKRLEMRVQKIEKILIFLSQIKTAIEFTADNVEGIFSWLTTSCDFSSLPFVAICTAKMGGGASFFASWSEALSKRENVVPLKKEDVALLLSFGSALGATDSAGQIQNCEMHEKLFKERLSAAVSEKNTLSKPARVVGILTGAIVLILFL